MFLDYTPAELALRDRLRAYFADLLTDEVRRELLINGESGPLYRSLVRRLGRDGWLGIGWPVEHGGAGRPAVEQFIFFEEAMRAGVPVPLLSLNTVAPMLAAHGSPPQKRMIPDILRGELVVAVGYSEPGAGTDLAGLSTQAVRDGGHYVVNGTKVYTSHAHDADYVWLACRTDPASSRHHGISILLVATDSPGFSFSPIHTVGGVRTNVSYYDDVVVPVENLVGEEHGGWALITAQLTHERVALAAFGGLAYRLWEEVAAWSRHVDAGGTRPVDADWVQAHLAEAWARLEAMKLLNWRLASATAAGTVGAADASAGKIYGTECLVEVYRLLLEVLGPAGRLATGEAGAVLGGEVERAARAAQVSTFAGGVNEIQRDLVARHALGMQRTAR